MIPEARDRLAHVADARGFPADDATLATLLRYVEAVVEAGRKVNLTAARDLDRAVDVLALSALAVVQAVPRSSRPALIVDLGTGNGLPGVAAALAWPDARVLLVERRRKKARAVAGCIERVGIANAEVITCDGRELLRERPEVAGAADLVTIRAVGTLGDVVGIAAAWLAPGGRLAHWKGRGLPPEEEREGEAAARRAGLLVHPVLRFEDDAGPGRLVLYERPREG